MSNFNYYESILIPKLQTAVAKLSQYYDNSECNNEILSHLIDTLFDKLDEIPDHIQGKNDIKDTLIYFKMCSLMLEKK